MLSRTAGWPFGCDIGVDGEHAGLDGGDVSDADGRAGGGGFDDKLAELVGVVRLGSDEAKDELMVRLVEPGRVDNVGDLDGVDEV